MTALVCGEYGVCSCTECVGWVGTALLMCILRALSISSEVASHQLQKQTWQQHNKWRCVSYLNAGLDHCNKVCLIVASLDVFPGHYVLPAQIQAATHKSCKTVNSPCKHHMQTHRSPSSARHTVVMLVSLLHLNVIIFETMCLNCGLFNRTPAGAGTLGSHGTVPAGPAKARFAFRSRQAVPE